MSDDVNPDRFILDKQPSLMVSQCWFCKHWQGKSKCTAFPNGVPMSILVNEADHRSTVPGDNDIRFEAKSAKGKKLVDQYFDK